MADIKEPKELTIKKMEHRLAELQFNLSRQEVRRMEIMHELNIVQDNENSLKKMVEDQKSQIKEFSIGK
jgi:hypothetical protein